MCAIEVLTEGLPDLLLKVPFRSTRYYRLAFDRHEAVCVLMSSECSKVNERTFEPFTQTRAKQVMNSSTREMRRALSHDCFARSRGHRSARCERAFPVWNFRRSLSIYRVSAGCVRARHRCRAGDKTAGLSRVPVGPEEQVCYGLWCGWLDPFRIFPGRQLVMLHLRFSRQLFELAPS